MSSELSLEEIAARLSCMEEEVSNFRKVFTEWVSKKKREEKPVSPYFKNGGPFSDKSDVQQAINDLLEKLNIKGPAISAEELQHQMHQAGLEENEFSQGIIGMREE
jgi:hypothetical protein